MITLQKSVFLMYEVWIKSMRLSKSHLFFRTGWPVASCSGSRFTRGNSIGDNMNLPKHSGPVVRLSYQCHVSGLRPEFLQRESEGSLPARQGWRMTGLIGVTLLDSWHEPSCSTNPSDRCPGSNLSTRRRPCFSHASRIWPFLGGPLDAGSHLSGKFLGACDHGNGVSSTRGRSRLV
ncbi:hypothetical protein BDZ45DRAFT_426980 [Acephala macrosclerotiorum]|nr:hypothetical protein BDZ45DRAFT_426980 [Acephala macrosclerotiorum]